MEKFKKRPKEIPWSLKLDRELEALMRAADENGYSVPDLSREALREAFGALKRPPAEEPKAS
jgi:hypothetical protein